MTSAVIIIVVAVVALALGVLIGFFVGRSFVERRTANAQLSADRIIADAAKQAETAKKEALLEAKDQVFQMRPRPRKRSRSAARRSALRGSPDAARGEPRAAGRDASTSANTSSRRPGSDRQAGRGPRGLVEPGRAHLEQLAGHDRRPGQGSAPRPQSRKK